MLSALLLLTLGSLLLLLMLLLSALLLLTLISLLHLLLLLDLRLLSALLLCLRLGLGPLLLRPWLRLRLLLSMLFLVFLRLCWPLVGMLIPTNNTELTIATATIRFKVMTFTALLLGNPVALRAGAKKMRVRA